MEQLADSFGPDGVILIPRETSTIDFIFFLFALRGFKFGKNLPDPMPSQRLQQLALNPLGGGVALAFYSFKFYPKN